MAEKLNEVAALMMEANRLKSVAEEAQADFRAAQEQLVELMTAQSLPSVSAEDKKLGLQYTGTVVRSEAREVNEQALQRELGPHLWDQVTRRVLDQRKLDAHVVTGDISSDVVSKHTLMKPRCPYIKFTVKQISHRQNRSR